MTSRTISKAVLNAALSQHGDFSSMLAPFGASLKVCIDSRTIGPGEIFLAIRGDLDDGHNYIQDVAAIGAAFIIADASRRADFAWLPSVIFVSDTLRFLGAIAKAHLDSLSLTTIGITGSNGKTTTKEMIKALLSHLVGDDKVYSSAGNKNNLFGLPLCALEVTAEHRYAIFEMGMNQVGEMARLCTIVTPDAAIITNIGGAHAGNFADGVIGVRREKGELFKSIANGKGHAIINTDDEHVMALANEMTFRACTTFGHAQDAHLRIVHTSPYELALGIQTVRIANDDAIIDVGVPLAGAHHALNAAGALAVVKALGFSVADAALGLLKMQKIAGRMSVNLLASGLIMINDGYNANPVSMKAGITASKDFPAERRVAAIGAMGELGVDSDTHHFALGELLADNFDHIFICGEAAYQTVLGAKKSGMSKDRIVYRATSLELLSPLKALLRRGDLLFIKGSLSSNMQALANALAEACTSSLSS